MILAYCQQVYSDRLRRIAQRNEKGGNEITACMLSAFGNVCVVIGYGCECG